jgi:hypothetical protein
VFVSLWLAFDILLMILGGIGLLFSVPRLVIYLATTNQIDYAFSGGFPPLVGIAVLGSVVFSIGLLQQRARIVGFLRS